MSSCTNLFTHHCGGFLLSSVYQYEFKSTQRCEVHVFHTNVPADEFTLLHGDDASRFVYAYYAYHKTNVPGHILEKITNV